MKNLVSVVLIVHLVTLFEINHVRSFIIRENQLLMPGAFDYGVPDYLGYEEGPEIVMFDCEGKGCVGLPDAEDNELNLPTVDCSTGYDRNELPNEVHVLGKPSETEFDPEDGLAATTESDVMSSKELLDFLHSLSDLLDLDKESEDDSESNNIAVHAISDLRGDLDSSKGVELSDPEDPTILVVGFGSPGKSNDDTAVDFNDDSVADDSLRENETPDLSLEWMDESDESHRVVENGFIYYDLGKSDLLLSFSDYARLS